MVVTQGRGGCYGGDTMRGVGVMVVTQGVGWVLWW